MDYKRAELREAYEETNVCFEIDRLVFLHENFFVSDFNGNKPFHEISMFYLMKPSADTNNIVCHSMGADGAAESLHWLPMDQLSSYPVFPAFFQTGLRPIQNEFGHFITKDGHTYRTV